MERHKDYHQEAEQELRRIVREQEEKIAQLRSKVWDLEAQLRAEREQFRVVRAR